MAGGIHVSAQMFAGGPRLNLKLSRLISCGGDSNKVVLFDRFDDFTEPLPALFQQPAVSLRVIFDLLREHLALTEHEVGGALRLLLLFLLLLLVFLLVGGGLIKQGWLW